MADSVLLNQINKIVDTLNLSSNDIVVLKGIPIETVITDSKLNIDFESLVSNKFLYFSGIYGKRQFLTYEEFLYLKDFIIMQYENIYVLNNNIYMKLYPINLYCSEATTSNLITNFLESDDEANDDKEIGNTAELATAFIGLKEYPGFILGAYCDDTIQNEIKVKQINLFEGSDFDIPATADSDEELIDIIDEVDYIALVRRLMNNPDEIYIKTSNYADDKYLLNDRLKILASNWSEYTDIFTVVQVAKKSTLNHRSEYTDLLKKYWKHSEFRSIPVYNIEKLDKGEKEVMKVSQENIISDLVNQVENCNTESGNFRDMFVTAPTGAGKSVMFQIPAMYLAEKYNLLTIVISPLIGLMNDQVQSLEVKKYNAAKTINSDISPVIKQDIMDKVADGSYHILYISPETLLSRSAVEQLVGDRTIGMIVIDEAHIVTTWGKQFRPDYWYLGDHIRKLRKKQLETKGRAFVVATFTATAIYHGYEDMYTETINSLHMLNPITYLGYVKRNDIDVQITKPEKVKGQHSEYKSDKYEDIMDIVKRALITNKKTLVYFPTIAEISGCYEYLRSYKMASNVVIYHASLDKESKQEHYQQFLNGEKNIMLATKAFGMGIDIDNIEIVAHFAPTGNVCDYVQEIGRAARRTDLDGEAIYKFYSGDFKFINKFHGLQMIKEYQLVKVVEKIYELYSMNYKNGGKDLMTRKRNAMLLDAENFTYIFDNPISNENDNINKVKTALLIIQKDFESRKGFSPISIRPIPLFSKGYFSIDKKTQKKLLDKYPGCLEEIESSKDICLVYLDYIWKKDYAAHSFPQFKYLLYTHSPDLSFNEYFNIKPALCVSISYKDNYSAEFEKITGSVQRFINSKLISCETVALHEITKKIAEDCNTSEYKAKTICDVLFAAMDKYNKEFTKSTSSIYSPRTLKDGTVKYQFNVAINGFFNWLKTCAETIHNSVEDDKLFLINDGGNVIKEYNTVLGVLEAFDIISFEMLGGANSQLYIYVNQIEPLKNIINNPGKYHNRLLEMVGNRHKLSTKMLTYIYENEFESEKIWDIIEDYFLGIIPEKVKRDCLHEGLNLE